MLNDAVTSIKLMTHFTRVNDPENPGYLYSFDGTTNRFFIISKGKPRITDDKNGPFYRLFEQISPVRGDGGHRDAQMRRSGQALPADAAGRAENTQGCNHSFIS